MKLIQIKDSLEKLEKDFNVQIEALGKDSEDFHNSLIDLVSRYPEHKELIQFIVFVNDKLETKQSMFSDVISDSFNEIVAIKKQLLYNMIEDTEDTNNIDKNVSEDIPKGFWSGIMSKVKTFKDIKIILITIAIIAVVIGVILAPNEFIAVVKGLAKISI